ncbi:MAG TPA: UvrB/UvrC motif-containing protein [Dictyoglomaceae bacterium]|nr:UvrB/UvrC motif-containing protein [Dictyoglomaceae bacterium]HOL39124.1 UvrB/UvrC motif-containing protein [Dictyoglomaceae bacterium]HOP94267.1 UvrB/UvrC motif-containing protein [Dictyoglomaceae bacterium]HPP15278.1 UvrB/UvrC motif-containing protein [Dictyoglomaceae bacterium]HPU42684.1 UvrB/UvrC motif-containing protein [Dictyoglomaceae bacterium]
MICDLCHKNKAEYILEVNNEEGKRRYSLCESCLQEIVREVLQSSMLFEKEIKDLDNCPKCDREWEEIEESGIVGCSYCYVHFADKLESMISQYHGEKVHKGKAPKKTVKKMENILRYKIELSKAIENEDYEKAAEIRDILRKFGKKGE